MPIEYSDFYHQIKSLSSELLLNEMDEMDEVDELGTSFIFSCFFSDGKTS